MLLLTGVQSCRRFQWSFSWRLLDLKRPSAKLTRNARHLLRPTASSFDGKEYSQCSLKCAYGRNVMMNCSGERDTTEPGEELVSYHTIQNSRSTWQAYFIVWLVTACCKDRFSQNRPHRRSESPMSVAIIAGSLLIRFYSLYD